MALLWTDRHQRRGPGAAANGLCNDCWTHIGTPARVVVAWARLAMVQHPHRTIDCERCEEPTRKLRAMEKQQRLRRKRCPDTGDLLEWRPADE